MLGEGPFGYRVREVFRVADCARRIDPQCRVMSADIVEQPGQIFLEMPALGEEERDDSDVPDAFGGQSGNGRSEGRLHQFQKRQFHANAGLLLVQPCHDPAERLRPRRIAGTMGKQQDCRSRRLAHAINERSCILTSVADWEPSASINSCNYVNDLAATGRFTLHLLYRWKTVT
jgi:hypothetical protein